MHELNMIMIAFPNAVLARQALAALGRSQDAGRISLDDGLLVSRHGCGPVVDERVGGSGAGPGARLLDGVVLRRCVELVRADLQRAARPPTSPAAALAVAQRHGVDRARGGALLR